MGKATHNNPNLTVSDLHKILYNQFPKYSFSVLKKGDEAFTVEQKGQRRLIVTLYEVSKDRTIYTVYEDKKFAIIYLCLPFWPVFMIMYVLSLWTKEAIRNEISVEVEILDFIKASDFSTIEIPKKYHYEGWPND